MQEEETSSSANMAALKSGSVRSPLVISYHNERGHDERCEYRGWMFPKEDEEGMESGIAGKGFGMTCTL